MVKYDLSNGTTTDFENQVPDFIVDAISLDNATPNSEETYHYFQDATKWFGYYLSIPEIFSAANAMATWAFGAGWSTDDTLLRQELMHVVGIGNDNFSKIMWNHEVMKLVVGDAFIEVKRATNKSKVTKIVNMIPISPERIRVVFNKSGMIKRYDAWNGDKWREVKKENMLHSSNKRIGDQMGGTSQIAPAKFIIDARNEALSDERIIKHRDKALGIAYYKTDKASKITYANEQIEKAVKNGEMVGLPEDTAEIKPYPSRGSEDRTSWVLMLENFLYQVFGVPRGVATSDGTSEVGGKMANVNFEPTYAKERFDMEDDLWGQQAILIKFEKQTSLGGLVQSDEAKNTGQTSIQPNDVTADLERE